MESAVKFPPLKWAQRADVVIVTCDVVDATEIVCDVDETSNKLIFKANSHDEKYGLDMELFEPIVKEESKWNIKGRNVIFVIGKKNKDEEEWWPRLTKDKVKNPLITIDWAKWRDPDEEDEGPDPMAGMDMGGMQGMGGHGHDHGGMGGMDPSMMAQMMGGAGGAGGMDPNMMA